MGSDERNEGGWSSQTSAARPFSKGFHHRDTESPALPVFSVSLWCSAFRSRAYRSNVFLSDTLVWRGGNLFIPYHGAPRRSNAQTFPLVFLLPVSGLGAVLC